MPDERSESRDMLFKSLPYIGKPYVVDKDNPPVVRRIVHTSQYNLSEGGQLEDYNLVMQKVADGLARVSFEEKVYDQDIKSWRVLIRWFDEVYEDPKENKKRKG